MSRFLHKIRALFVAYYAYMLEYRAEIFLWALTGILPFIMMGIWMKASAGGDFPLGPIGFARYFLAVFLVRQLTIVWVVWDFEYEIVEGKLSAKLLQPLDPMWRFFTAHLAERITRVPLLTGLTAFFFVLYPAAFWVPGCGTLLLALLAIVWAFLLRFAIQYTFAMLDFWTERASALEQLWFLLYLFLSGIIAPLEVFPPLIRRIALLTPFPYLVYFPSQILVGMPVQVAEGLTIILIWFIGFVVINRLLWRRGLKQYTGMGA